MPYGEGGGGGDGGEGERVDEVEELIAPFPVQMSQCWSYTWRLCCEVVLASVLL